MGITLDELIFDPSDPTEGANVGATLKGADGTVIGNTGDALKVTGTFNVDGSEVSLDAPTIASLQDIRDLVFATDSVDVSGSSVTVTATDLDIRDLAFATDSVDVSGSDITATVSATDLDIRDLTFATDKVDASGSEVKQDSYDSIKNTAQTVTNTASALASTPLASRVNMLIQNLGTKDIWIGSSAAVTDSNGIKVPKGGSAEFMFSAASTPHAITSSGTADVRLLEMAY